MNSVVSVAFPEQTQELLRLLDQDQTEWRNFSSEEWDAPDKSLLDEKRKALRGRIHQRAERTLQILDEIGEPTITNIGRDGAVALSVLATHSSLRATRKVLAAFNACYERNPKDVHCPSITAMTDWACLLERKPQQFGTIWLFDENKWPYLPTVQDFDHINERRAKYGIEPLHWPKSLAIPGSRQPWLDRPLSELVMRDLTDQEYQEMSEDYLA